MTTLPSMPNLSREESLWAAGIEWVAGVDEAGRGALAGPVVAATVILRRNTPLAGLWSEVRDSKVLSAAAREALEQEIQALSAAWAVGSATVTEIDKFGVAVAARLAMGRAVAELKPQPQHLLIDWECLPEVRIEQTNWAKADLDSVSVAAASILAKVWRDRLLVELDAVYPAFGFAQHKGYATEHHRNSLAIHGPCPEHRLSFAPVAQCRSLFDLPPDAVTNDIPSEPGNAR